MFNFAPRLEYNSERPLVVCFILRRKPLRFCHVSRCVEGFTKSDLWTDSDVERHSVCLEDMRKHLPDITEQILDLYAEEVLLFFWTYSAFFTVVYHGTSQLATSYTEYAEQPRPIIHDKDGSEVGRICKTAAIRGEVEIQEFVAVGQRQILGLPENMVDDVCPPVILALQIGRNPQGIASRVNYAEISLKAWRRTEPKAVLIALK